MAKFILDYAFPIQVIDPTPQASTAFLKQVCLACLPSEETEASVGDIVLCESMEEVALLTDNEDAEQFFDAGMTKVYIVLVEDLNFEPAFEALNGDFYTLIISSDFNESFLGTPEGAGVKAKRIIGGLIFTAAQAGVEGTEISITMTDTNTGNDADVSVTGSAITISIDDSATTATTIKDAIEASEAASNLVTVEIVSGQAAVVQDDVVETFLLGLYYEPFEGVVSFATDDEDIAEAWALEKNIAPFLFGGSVGAKNMCFAFGKLLSNLRSWKNNQYIEMPFDDGVDNLTDANRLFSKGINFVLTDDEFDNRLAFFVCGDGANNYIAIVAPYVNKNLRVDLQNRALTWIIENQPSYTIKNATLLEERLTKDVIEGYIERGDTESASIEISLVEDNFVADGEIAFENPKALWKVNNTMRVSN